MDTTKGILEYKPESLPQESGERVSFTLESYGLALLDENEYIINTIGNMVIVTKK